MASRTELEAAQGRRVRCADGQELGWVSECREESFLCDRRGFFRSTWVIRYADVARIDADAVVLARPFRDYRGPTLRDGTAPRPSEPAKPKEG